MRRLRNPLFSAVILGIALLSYPSDVSAKGTVSFTFDDGAKTIYTNGLPVMQKYGLPATIYLSTAYIGQDSWYMTWTQVGKLKSAKWEIASHGHEHDDLTTLTAAEIGTNFDASVATLKQKGYAAYSFATPYGSYDDTVIAEAEKKFCSHRQAWDYGGTANEGFNDPKNIDAYHISATELKNGMSMTKFKQLITRAEKENKWLVFLAHGVVTGKAGDYEITKTKLDQMMAYAKSRKDAGKIDVKTVVDVTGKCSR